MKLSYSVLDFVPEVIQTVRMNNSFLSDRIVPRATSKVSHRSKILKVAITTMSYYNFRNVPQSAEDAYEFCLLVQHHKYRPTVYFSANTFAQFLINYFVLIETTREMQIVPCFC